MIPDNELVGVWTEFKRTGDVGLRTLLANYYLNSKMFKIVIDKLFRLYRKKVRRTELVTCGFFGLHDALDKFKLERGYKFETYAPCRIRGAIMDAVGESGWISARTLRRARAAQVKESELASTLGHTPSLEEVCEGIGVTKKQHALFRKYLEAPRPFSLDRYQGRELAVSHIFQDEDKNEEGGEQEKTSDLRERMLDGLTERERAVVIGHRFELKTQVEVAAELGVCRMTVTRCYGKVMRQLKREAARRFPREFEAFFG